MSFRDRTGNRSLGPLRGPNAGRSGGARPSVVLGIVLVLAIGYGVLHNRLQAQGRNDPVLSGVRAALMPLQTGVARTRAAAQGTRDAYLSGGQLQHENARLQTEVDRLQVENETLRAHALEADRLRDALHFARDQKQPPLLASVIGWLPSPHHDTLIVGRGTRDGVKAKNVVRTSGGLVGTVMEAGPVSCEVLLLSDPTSQVSAKIWRNNKATPALGIVQGTGRDGVLQMVYLKREDDVKPGDVVMSSGYGGVVAPDIPIGVVKSVGEDKPRFLKWAEVTPSAPSPGDLREVFLLR